MAKDQLNTKIRNWISYLSSNPLMAIQLKLNEENEITKTKHKKKKDCAFSTHKQKKKCKIIDIYFDAIFVILILYAYSVAVVAADLFLFNRFGNRNLWNLTIEVFAHFGYFFFFFAYFHFRHHRHQRNVFDVVRFVFFFLFFNFVWIIRAFAIDFLFSGVLISLHFSWIVLAFYKYWQIILRIFNRFIF